MVTLPIEGILILPEHQGVIRCSLDTPSPIKTIKDALAANVFDVIRFTDNVIGFFDAQRSRKTRWSFKHPSVPDRTFYGRVLLVGCDIKTGEAIPFPDNPDIWATQISVFFNPDGRYEISNDDWVSNHLASKQE